MLRKKNNLFDQKSCFLGVWKAIFLVPHHSFDLNQLDDNYDISIHWNGENREKGWYIQSRSTGKILFSFDLPMDIFTYYAEHDMLSPTRALDLKEDIFTEVQAISTMNNHIRLIRFKLDREWLSSMRTNIRRMRE